MSPLSARLSIAHFRAFLLLFEKSTATPIFLSFTIFIREEEEDDQRYRTERERERLGFWICIGIKQDEIEKGWPFIENKEKMP